MSLITYTFLNSKWSILSQAALISASVIEAISFKMTGLKIIIYLGYFSVDYFFIDADLIKQHFCQRLMQIFLKRILSKRLYLKLNLLVLLLAFV